MPDKQTRYIISVETQNAPGAPVPVVRAETPEGAGEIVRILLAQGDGAIMAITIKPERVL